MKKILLSFSRYLSGFLAAITVLSVLPLYMMLIVPTALWVGSSMTRNGFTDNFGGLLIKFLENDYITFFLLPFLPPLGMFLIFSVFIWIFYRHDKEASRIGFKNTVLCVLAIFSMVLLPILGSQFDYKIQDKRKDEMEQFNRNDTETIYINKGFDKEFLKLYQTLADEGIQAWRKDPVAVVKYELEIGDLTSLNRGTNELSLKATSTRGTVAVVMLKNEELQAEISLNRYWETADGVWLVKSYKILIENHDANDK